jgi:hypothetical protein
MYGKKEAYLSHLKAIIGHTGSFYTYTTINYEKEQIRNSLCK